MSELNELHELCKQRRDLPPVVAAYVTYLVRKARVSPLNLSEDQQKDIQYLTNQVSTPQSFS